MRKPFLAGVLFRKRLAALQILMLLLALICTPLNQASAQTVVRQMAGGFNDPAFERIWLRSDLPVISGATARSLMWGQEIIRKWQEPYKEAKGGSRIVVYFDKARMEITDPDADPNGRFYVTNGLLVKEMISGQLQLGDDTFQTFKPADNVAIAGDPLESNPGAPTYASLTKIASLNNDNPAASRFGQTVSQTLAADGTLRDDPELARKYGITIGAFDENLKHNIPDVFVRFLNQRSLVNEGGQNVQGQVIDGLAAVGLPLHEPLWTRAKVAGVDQDVLVQAFERRVLTYTPANPEAYRVEMGNAGLHYYRWRYQLEPFRYENQAVGAGGAMVATANPYASAAGYQILQNGGNAVDAAIGIMFALGVVEPSASGIGGGGFMLIRTKAGQTVMLDSREMAPAGAKPDMFIGSDGKPLAFTPARLSGKAVGVPGALKLASYALQKYGTRTIAEVIIPGTRLAEEGFVVTPRFLEANSDPSSRPVIENTEAAKAIFLPGGKPVAPGTLFKQGDLARTYKLIAQQGEGLMYGDNDFARALVKAVQDKGGSMTVEDLKKYTVKEREPIQGSYRGYDLYASAPPSSGGLTMLQILKLLEPYNLTSYGQNSANHLHLLIEASRLAFADRGKYLGDEDFVKLPRSGMLNPAYLDSRRALISLDKANPDIKPGNPFDYEGAQPQFSNWQASGEQAEGRQTSHFVVVDKEGNIVSYTNTIESAYGTGIVVPGYGVLLNNELTDFDFIPGGPNQVEPLKRPRSSMNPVIILKDGKFFMAVGAAGGATIILSTTQIIMNVIDFGMSVQEAINAPRVYGPFYPNVSWEIGISKTVRDGLTARGHKLADNPGFLGVAQAITVSGGETLVGGADYRRDGTVRGLPG